MNLGSVHGSVHGFVHCLVYGLVYGLVHGFDSGMWFMVHGVLYNVLLEHVFFRPMSTLILDTIVTLSGT